MEIKLLTILLIAGLMTHPACAETVKERLQKASTEKPRTEQPPAPPPSFKPPKQADTSPSAPVASGDCVRQTCPHCKGRKIWTAQQTCVDCQRNSDCDFSSKCVGHVCRPEHQIGKKLIKGKFTPAKRKKWKHADEKEKTGSY